MGRNSGFGGGRGGMGMGGGGGNMQNLLKQAQKMQADMAAKQEELAGHTVTATAGGGMVEATASGSRRILSVIINPEVANPEDIDMLQDLVLAAVNGALDKADELVETEMGKISGGLPTGMF